MTSKSFVSSIKVHVFFVLVFALLLVHVLAFVHVRFWLCDNQDGRGWNTCRQQPAGAAYTSQCHSVFVFVFLFVFVFVFAFVFAFVFLLESLSAATGLP